MSGSEIYFSGDASDYSRVLAKAMRDRGYDLIGFERSEELGGEVRESCEAIIIVNPHVHQARAARNVMQSAGGLVSRIPLVAALRDAEQMSEAETLKHFDDFLLMPAGGEELEARIKLVGLRRGRGSRTIVHGELVINLDAHQVIVAGRPVDLTYKEYELLKALASTPGRAYSRDDLLKNIWGYDYFGGTRTVDVHVRRVRSKIEQSGAMIETVHGVGYRFTNK